VLLLVTLAVVAAAVKIQLYVLHTAAAPADDKTRLDKRLTAEVTCWPLAVTYIASLLLDTYGSSGLLQPAAAA
jgi:hypothetical protein